MIKNIIFPGGGLRCWAYIGTIRALYEHKTPDLEHIVGTSAGSFFGCMFILGISWEFLLEFFVNLNLQEVIDIDINNILVQESLLAGIKFTQIMKELISYRVDPDITFKDLFCYSKITFTVNALNINTGILENFNYLLTPDIKVVDAIRASCSLPFIFPPYRINGDLYYDGGLCNNCPVDIVEELSTIAFDITCPTERNTNKLNLLNLMDSLINLVNKTHYTENSIVYNILDITFKGESFNFNQSRDDIFNMYMTGYINSRNILFNHCIAIENTK